MVEIHGNPTQGNTAETAPVSPRIAFYGGSFDPIHGGHMAIAMALIGQFDLDEFVFIPAFHAPHKVRLRPTSAYDRYAMLSLATQNEPDMKVSRMEIEAPARPFTVETLTRLNAERPDVEKFFVMGADSWMDIRTWREWEMVLTMSNHIVVTRPGVEIGFGHVTKEIRDRVVDIRVTSNIAAQREDMDQKSKIKNQIFFTDSVNLDISATRIRQMIRENNPAWLSDVAPEVANYIEKYQIYR